MKKKLIVLAAALMCLSGICFADGKSRATEKLSVQTNDRITGMFLYNEIPGSSTNLYNGKLTDQNTLEYGTKKDSYIITEINCINGNLAKITFYSTVEKYSFSLYLEKGYRTKISNSSETIETYELDEIKFNKLIFRHCPETASTAEDDDFYAEASEDTSGFYSENNFGDYYYYSEY